MSNEPIAPPLPNNVNAERSVLGAIMLNNHALETAIEELKAEDFFLHEHRRIFLQMIELGKAKQPIDLITLSDQLRRRSEIEAAGGEAYLSQLIDGVPRVSNVAHYARIVREKSIRRFVAHSANALKTAALDSEDVFELKNRAENLAVAIPSGRDERGKIVTATELLAMTVTPREFLLEGLIVGRSMNEIFAWRGVGKTWAALSLAYAIATGGQFLKWNAPRRRSVLFVDGELDAASLQQRIRSLNATSCYPADRLKLLCCDMQDDPFPNLATRRAQRFIEDALTDCELLVLDNLSALAPSSNETEAEDWIAIQTWLLDLRRRGIASLFLHHSGHAGWARGTTRREDLLDLVLELRRPKDYVASEGLRFELHFTKTRGMLGAGAEPIEARLGTDKDGNVAWTWRDLEDVRIKPVCELRKAGNSFRDIENRTGVPKATAERLWKKHGAYQ
jgi:hypothetical protein